KKPIAGAGLLNTWSEASVGSHGVTGIETVGSDPLPLHDRGEIELNVPGFGFVTDSADRNRNLHNFSGRKRWDDTRTFTFHQLDVLGEIPLEFQGGLQVDGELNLGFN